MAVTHTIRLAEARTRMIRFGLVAVIHMIPHTTQLIHLVMVDTVADMVDTVVVTAETVAVTAVVTKTEFPRLTNPIIVD